MFRLLITCLGCWLISPIHAQTPSAQRLNGKLTLLIELSKKMAEEHDADYAAIMEGHENRLQAVNAHLGNAGDAIQQEYNQNKQQVDAIRSQGTTDDINIITQMAISGDAGSMVIGGALGLFNAAERKRNLKEKEKADREARMAAQEKLERARREADQKLNAFVKKNLQKLTDGFVEQMNVFLPAAPVYTALSEKSSPRITEAYFFVCYTQYDRLYVSTILRIDRLSNNAWWRDATQELLQQSLNEISSGKLKTMLQEVKNRYKIDQENFYFIGQFSTYSAAEQELFNLVQSAVVDNKIPVLRLLTIPQLSRKEIDIYLAESDSYWGIPIDKINQPTKIANTAQNLTENSIVSISSQSKTQPVKQGNKETKQTQQKETQSQPSDQVTTSAAPARVTTASDAKADDFWGDSPATQRGAVYRQIDGQLTIRVIINREALEVVESENSRQLPPGSYKRESNGIYQYKNYSFSISTDQTLTYTDKHITLKFSPKP